MSEESIFKNASPKLTFLLGAMIGIAAIATVGFFITLSRLNSDGTSTAKAKNTNTAAVAGVNTNAAAAPTAAAPTGSISNFVLPTGEDVYLRGNPDAPIKLVEYTDFECPYCKQHHPTMKQVMDQYGDQVAWIIRHYPLSFHANAQKEAEASECVGKLGGNDAFWQFTDAIFNRTTSNGTGFALTALTPLAEEIGLDGTAFQECFDSGQFTAQVQGQLTEGSGFGVSGTPGTILFNETTDEAQLIEGALPYASFTQAIDSALQGV